MPVIAFFLNLWSRVGGGCPPNRSTAAAIEAAGFGIEQIDRFSYAPLRFFPKHSHILACPSQHSSGVSNPR